MSKKEPYEKAVEETAKAMQQLTPVIDKQVDRLSGFLHTVIGAGAEHLGGAFKDWAATYRYKNALKLADQVERIHAERKLLGKTVPILPRLAIPLLENAALEDDDILGVMWAGLIANATDPNRNVEARRSFVDLLKALEPLDALVLKEIERQALENSDRNNPPFNLSDEIWRKKFSTLQSISTALQKEPMNVALSLENIERLGLAYDFVAPDGTAIGVPVPLSHKFAVIDLTNTGRVLLTACKN